MQPNGAPSYSIDVIFDARDSAYRALPSAELYFEPIGQDDRKAEATRALLPRQLTDGLRWANWGKDDRFPTTLREKIEQVPMAGQAIYKLIALMYGNSLGYYRNADRQSDNNRIKRAYIPKVEQFLRRNRIPLRWLVPQFGDYRYYMNCFSEMILSKDKQQITGIYHKSAEHCRRSIQNPDTLYSEYLLYSPSFACGYPEYDKVKRVPIFDWQDEERFLRRLVGYKFAWHSRFETPGAIYYARPFWVGLFRKNGWVDASIAVPEIVNAMMKNQISLKYQINIPESYFVTRYPEWNSYTAKRKDQIFKSLVTTINTMLSGTENAYRSVAFYFQDDVMGGSNSFGKVEIIPIDDKIKRDSWVPSAEKSDAQVVQGLGLHPSQVGLAPEGGKMGAGSGSDQRESYNTQITINTLDQDIVLEPLNFVAEFNSRTDPDWDVSFFIDHTWHTTTNLQESGMQQDGDKSLIIEP